MNSISGLTYEMFLAYALPGAITVLIYLALLNDRLNLTLDTNSAGYLVLGFISLSVVVGLLFDMLSVAVLSRLFRFQQNRRNEIFFGKPDKPSVLLKHMEALYPDTTVQDKVELVYAIFNSYVPEHIYSRRNYDWYFHMASRNILINCPFPISGLGLLAWRYAWPIALIAIVFVATIVVLVVLYLFMLRQLEIYYGFYRNVVLGHLLERAAQAVGGRRSMTGTEEAGGN